MTLSEIINENNEEKLIETVGQYIWDNCEKNDGFDKLTAEEYNFVMIDIFESAMNQGGLMFFFKEDAGNFQKEICKAYRAINAPETAKIIDKAIAKFPLIPFPTQQDVRVKAVANIPEELTQYWEDLEEEFFKYEEDVFELTLQYIKENPKGFRV